MKKTLTHETYPLYTLQTNKNECPHSGITGITQQLRHLIEQHERASFINIFDHLQQLRDIPPEQICEDIVSAYSILFYFGLTLPTPQVTATNPRSIGVVELTNQFIITFLETPMPLANTTMEKWAQIALTKPHKHL